MADKIDAIPENMTIAEASEFWDTHSVADYPSQVVEMEFESEEQTTLVVVLDPDVAEVFQSSEAVNEALRVFIKGLSNLPEKKTVQKQAV